MKLLENKTALITGASRGIGRKHALLFAENGANIIFTDLREDDNSRSLVEELTSKGTKCRFVAADVSDYQQTTDIVKIVEQEFGRLDVLVNNAGITRDNLILRMSPNDWDAVIMTNLKSVYNYCKAFTPMMLKQRSGSIINISSIVAINGNAGQCNYAAAKAGILGFTRSLAKELGSRNVRCNAVAPGFIETPMTQKLSPEARQHWMDQIPLHRGGTDQDVARVSLFLASELAEYVTGQVICCDGGLVL
ncbi:MAG: 3-oxoacyl-[Bacteroidales bacterium]|nr:3-oxoacyl-[acyl-carrier-protein] reductase [Bacteroidales bacterium]MBR3413103.1 3-oxoacyl-[acyl-carrier-protein] reductase [Bacteroidales bacterium]